MRFNRRLTSFNILKLLRQGLKLALDNKGTTYYISPYLIGIIKSIIYKWHN
jgi:hypothetical protein